MQSLTSRHIVPILAFLCSSFSLHGGTVPRQMEFLSAYNAAELNNFCGNSPGTSGDDLVESNGVSKSEMGLLLVGQIRDCLRVEVPRPEITNRLCSLSLLKLTRFRTAESASVAQAAYLDGSDSFRSESLSAFFACVSNAEDVVCFTSNVWADVSSHSASRRLDCLIALKRWIPRRANLSEPDRQAIFTCLADRASGETSFPVAMRLDRIMNALSDDYSTSSTRTNLVLRFKDNTSAPKDPLYFHRLAEAMGIEQ